MANTRNYSGYIPVGVESRIINDSEVIKVGDFITDEGAGMANVDAATEDIKGVAIGFIDSKGRSLEAVSADTGSLGGTWASSTKSYTAAADNTTVDLVKVLYNPINENQEFVATLDDDAGTTAGPVGYYFPIKTSDSALLEESGATLTETGMQFVCTDDYAQGLDTEIVVKVVNRASTLKELS